MKLFFSYVGNGDWRLIGTENTDDFEMLRRDHFKMRREFRIVEDLDYYDGRKLDEEVGDE